MQNHLLGQRTDAKPETVKIWEPLMPPRISKTTF